MGDKFFPNAEFATNPDLAVKRGLKSVWTVDRSCAAALNRVALHGHILYDWACKVRSPRHGTLTVSFAINFWSFAPESLKVQIKAKSGYM